MENIPKEINWILQEKYKGKMTAGAKKDIARFEAGEPLDHIIGFMEFLGCKILAGPNALIPRFETEFWTEQGIEEVVKNDKKNPRILDMFAGSGAIGISIMRHIKNVHLVFAESEKPAIEQIKKNCALNKLSPKNYEIIQSDIFSNVSGTFDYIFANPPYIPLKQKHLIQKSVIDFEPHPALFGGEDGLEFIRRFLVEAKNHLNEGGKIFMEFDITHKNKIATLCKKNGYKNWEFKKDQYNRWRWIIIVK